ncbi:hypothetical protein IWW55_005148 [Coemansia sp. RSA 2706]|nr:hypothetical protein IWW55_005148 [Coemansia sp. RSA 2706]KAJ2306260.1 hypothetical protein IWW54_004809 [Coemansia sp. RSA 2705]KAJ2370739.1 hypothetical protein H4S01_000118 [Coemansia sp. RSA 2610]KAJ2722745.1 hypothetical protein H4R23_004435 [Coemansia sp. Cherry 401B]
MDDETQQLVAMLAADLAGKVGERRHIVAISGVPGSGKSYLSQQVCAALNAHAQVCAVLPMDGFHLTKRQLQQMPDAPEALRRRGAHWTFDGAAFIATMRRVRDSEHESVRAPAFDHAVGDPVSDGIEIRPHHRIVLAEGLYAHVGAPPWGDIAGIADELWWVEPRDTGRARQRLARRHLDARLAHTEAEAYERIATNDSLNGQYSEQNRLPPTRTIPN